MSKLESIPRIEDPSLGPDAPSWGWGRWAWKSLTSMRTAVILLGLLGLAAIPGSLLPQRNVATDPAAVSTFIENNPGVSPWLDRLSLFDVYASPWFAAIYLLLLVSMIGCVVPRSARLWRNVWSPPPDAPRHLRRLEGYRTWESDRAPEDLVAQARGALSKRGFRVVASSTEVGAERGYLREVGNLLFHLSLLVLLLGIAGGRLFGFEGRIAVAEGRSFTNVQSEYDAFYPSVWTDTAGLEPFTMTLDEFQVEYEDSGPQMGQPSVFDAKVSYVAEDGVTRQVEVSPNNPLDVDETKMFLTGNGYAPRVTVRDGTGAVASSGPVIFLPNDATFASDGVIKAPDAVPTQLGFEALFLPTASSSGNGPPISAFPDAVNPQLAVTAWTGDLGLSAGGTQSVYVLDKTKMTAVTGPDGAPLRETLEVGDTMTLPNGAGSLTFDGVARFANFQVARDPGKELSLLAAVLLLVGLTTSLMVRRRRMWVRVTPLDPVGGSPRTRVEVARLSLTRREPPARELHHVMTALGGPAEPIHEEPTA